MRGGAAALALSLLAGLLPAAPAAAEWRSEQPVSSALGVPVELGEVGDVECWQANRCVLITAGNGGVPAGIFAYDGAGWYRYATVCGGHEGRIAWAGPSEFWTISDQQVGQETGQAPPEHISLCHFRDGEVVASYAKPVGVAGSYLPMDAAACLGPNDCWFAGERLPGTVNNGAFHLRWDGGSLTAIPSLTATQPELEDPGRSVVGLAFHGGILYEGVRAQEGDIAAGESASQPYLLHQVDLGSPGVFFPLFPEQPIVYGGGGAKPTQLEGFRLSGSDEGLWAISGAGATPARVTVLRLSGGSLGQVALDDPAGVFGPEDHVHGVAADPGSDAAWVAFSEREDFSASPARLTRVHADGAVDPPVFLPKDEEGIGRKGRAGPVVCAAAGQCWMATERGWLFHLGADPPQDTDPAMHVLVTYRPADESLPFVPPVSLPEDDSGATSPYERTEELVGEGELSLPRARRRRALLSKVHQRLIHGTVLELSFTLRAKAHVRLVAKRHRRVVAKTRRYTMREGRRRLRLRLDPKRWPTKLDLQAHAVKARGKK